MSLKVLRISGGAALEDLGRPGWRRFGVPPGGAFDRESFLLANAMLGNPPDTPALELTVFGAKLEALAPVRVAVVGADCEVKSGGVVGASNGVFLLATGDILDIGMVRRGARVYVGAAGGFVASRIQGSVSGVPVTKDQDLVVGEMPVGSDRVRLTSPPATVGATTVRVLPAADAELGLSALLESGAELTPMANRTGLRLEAGLPGHRLERPSEPSAWGTVQLTPNGQILLLGPNGPTVGGYPKLATVIDADLDYLAQWVPGTAVRFEEVTLAQAQEAAVQRLERLRKLESELRASLRAAE